MPSLEQKSFQRQVAYKVRISDLLNGTLAKTDASAGYVRLNELNVSRANIIATIVYKSEEPNYASAVLDDGTGKISLKSFENKGIFSGVNVSDAVLVVGKVRQFNDEKYIIPEIMKRLENAEWFNVRKLELKNFKPVSSDLKVLKAGNGGLAEESISSFNDDIYSLIKKLDIGEGVLVEDVVKNSKNIKAEGIITKLLENGDIFEIKPGRLKVLE